MQADFDRQDLDQWLAWLEKLHPSTIDLGLERVRKVFDRLQLDLRPIQCVIVGGTNGKGSTVAMMAATLRAAGHTVGTYTSPHLLRYNERVCLDGEPVDDASLCAAFAAVEAVRDDVSLTYFEYGTLAALVLFAERRPEYLVLEVGLGGRLDAVNIIEPALSILTNVALDHVDWLGSTREAIGREKSGIFRAGKPAVYGESDIPDSVLQTAKAFGTRLLRKGVDYTWEAHGTTWTWRGHDAQGQALELKDLPRNGFPFDNGAAVVQALQYLCPGLPETALREGLGNVVVPGRFQELRHAGRKVILDVAHNPHAAANLAHNLQTRVDTGRVLMVLAMLGDKDSAGVISLLAPRADRLYAAPLGGERGSSAEIIYNHARKLGHAQVSRHDSVAAAFQAALADSEPADTVVVTGSFHTVAAVLELI